MEGQAAPARSAATQPSQWGHTKVSTEAGPPARLCALSAKTHPFAQCTMSYLLPHLHSGWAVDQAILSEEVRAGKARTGTAAEAASAAEEAAPVTLRANSHSARA